MPFIKEEQTSMLVSVGTLICCVSSTCLTPWTFLIAWLISRRSSFSSNTIWDRGMRRSKRSVKNSNGTSMTVVTLETKRHHQEPFIRRYHTTSCHTIVLYCHLIPYRHQGGPVSIWMLYQVTTFLRVTLTLNSSRGNRSWKMRLILAPPKSSLVSTWSPEPSMHFSKSTPNCWTILIRNEHKKHVCLDTWCTVCLEIHRENYYS